mgnify:CR=1 FL=1
MLGRKRKIQWQLIESILIENSAKITNSEMWKVVIYLPIEKGSLYKRNKENLELLGWTVVETFEEEYFIIPTAMFFLQDKLVG